MYKIPQIHISDYDYDLPAGRIAVFPVEPRDSSKLLTYKKGSISDNIFNQFPDLLPQNSFLVLNNTRVIYARLIFHKPSGSKIEIFCLEPLLPFRDVQLAMQQKKECTWKCLVGNASRWKNDRLQLSVALSNETVILEAEIIERGDDTFTIHFEWYAENISFAEILENAGKVPLPPYIRREAVPEDKERYQTVFAQYQGSVAAPTAGLHFTSDVFKSLHKKNIQTEYVVLHVGAGTFKPVSAANISEHIMHKEQVVVSEHFLRQIISAEKDIIAVGTTSVRSLESLYYLGMFLWKNKKLPDTVSQWMPYESYAEKLNRREAIEVLINYVNSHHLKELRFSTEIIIVPGYTFKMADGMLTNFHQPKSTLLLLIAAFLGDEWKRIYDHALKNDYRFLSYGDACLFLK